MDRESLQIGADAEELKPVFVLSIDLQFLAGGIDQLGEVRAGVVDGGLGGLVAEGEDL